MILCKNKSGFERKNENKNKNNKNKKGRRIILNLSLVILLLALPLVTTQTVHAKCWTKCDTCTRTVCDTCYKTVCEKKKVCQTCYKWECDTCKRTVCTVYYKWECDTCKKTVCNTCYKTVCDTCYKRIPYTCTKKVWTTCQKRVCKNVLTCSSRYLSWVFHNQPEWVFIKELKRCTKKVCEIKHYPCLSEEKHTCYRTEPYKCHCRKVPYKCNCHEKAYSCNCRHRPHRYCHEETYRCNCHSKPYPCNCREYYDCHRTPYKCNCHKENYPCNCNKICKNEPPTVTILEPRDGTTLRTASSTVKLPVKVRATDDRGLAWIIVYIDGHQTDFTTGGSQRVVTYKTQVSLTSGTHTITVKVKDTNGAWNSKSVKVTIVKNSPPSVTILEPRNGETIITTSGTVRIPVKVRATDDRGLSTIYMYRDGRFAVAHHLYGVSQTTYTTSVELAPGTHTITVKVEDTNSAQNSKSVKVTVIKNSPPSVTILEPKDGETLKTTGNTAKIPLRIRATDDRGLGWIIVYINGHQTDFTTGRGMKDYAYETQVSLSPGTHTVTVEVWDTDKAHSKSSVTIKVLRALRPSDVSVSVDYKKKVPLLLEKLPLRITIKKPPGDTLIQIYLQKRAKVLMKQDTCYNTVCTYDLELSLTDFLNVPHASITYKLLVTFDKDFTVEKTITLTRSSYFATGKEITLIYTIEKGTGPVKNVYLLYNGKKIYPSKYPRELYQQEELTVNVPFKVKVTSSAYATIVVCNYYGCDYRTAKILTERGEPPQPPQPPVTPTPRPTPPPPPLPKPTPTPTPPLKPTRPSINVVKVSVPEISWSHEYSKGGVPTVGK